MEIDPILNVLKTTFLQFKLEEIESGQFIEKIPQAEFISLNIHFEKGEEYTPTVYITPHKNKMEAVFKPTSIILIPNRDNDHKLNILQTPFSCRTNIIIDNPTFWESAREIRIRQLKIIPAILDEAICIETMKIPNPRTFKVNIKNDNQLNVNIWSFDEEREIDISNICTTKIIFSRNSNWLFRKYLANQRIEFDNMPELVFSFDESIVKESILIKRERQILPDEYYILVLRQ